MNPWKRANTDWFHAARWGVFCHYVGGSGNEATSADEWNRRVDAFDVPGLTRQLVDAGAPYFFITLGQNSGHYLTPNATYDTCVGINPSKCSRRDLVMDLAEALAPHGIRLLVYVPNAAPAADPVAMKALEWEWGFEGGWPHGNTVRTGKRLAAFQRRWEAVLREWSLRWGKKVHGWWIDGCYFCDEMYRHPEPPNFASFAAAMRAGNPESLVGWNPGVRDPVVTVDPEEDYTAGENNNPERLDCPGRWLQQAQYHVLSFLGQFWCLGPRRFNDDDAIRITRAITDPGGVLTWDVPIQEDGRIPTPFFDQLCAIGTAMRARPRPVPPVVPHLAKVKLEFDRVPLVSEIDGRREPGRLRLTGVNPWSEPVQTRVLLSVEPAGAMVVGDGRPVDTAVDAQSTASVPDLTLALRSAPDEPMSLVVEREGDPRRARYKVPVCVEFGLPELVALPELGQVAAALAEFAPRRAVTEDRKAVGDVRLACAGASLLLTAEVADVKLTTTVTMWDASCLEVFAAAPGAEKGSHIYLIPETAQGPARAVRLAGDQALAAPEIGLRTLLLPGVADQPAARYRLSAIVPLALLGLPPGTERFLLEVVVSAAPTPLEFERGRLFHSLHAHNSTHGYALAVREHRIFS